jgi:hypothetical protein
MYIYLSYAVLHSTPSIIREHFVDDIKERIAEAVEAALEEADAMGGVDEEALIKLITDEVYQVVSDEFEDEDFAGGGLL